MDGVAGQQSTYSRSGFRRAWNHIRYEGAVPVGDVPGDVTLVDGRAIPFHQIVDYDRRFFPATREAFLSTFLTLPGQRSVGAVRDGKLVGFGAVRPSFVGLRVGPLYASSDDVATALLAKLSELVSGGPLIVEVPDINGAAIKLGERLGFEPTSETSRMFTGPVPDLDLDGIYAPVSLELG